MAKDQKQPEPALEIEAIPDTVGPPKSYRLQITLGFVALILCQMIILWLLLPSRKQVQQNLGLDPVAGVGGFENTNLVPMNIGKEDPTEERPLKEGAFKVKDVRNDENVSFSIVLHVKVRKADISKFEKRYAECTNEVIERVTSTLRATTDEDRKEATFTAIKEKVKRAINEVLGTPWVLEVLCSDSSVDVQ